MKRYATARAFRTALEDRLIAIARRDAVDLHRLRRQVAFDRLLYRLTLTGPAEHQWVLKGGYALELRFSVARSTKDLDLTMRLNQTEPVIDRQAAIQQWLVLSTRRDSRDYFAFLVGAATLELDGAPDGGWRYPVEARVDGRTFVKFHLDVGLGDEVLPPIEMLAGRDWLGFAGFAPAIVPTLSAEQQWAEKLHAYTLPRTERRNSRVKDLVDLVLLIEGGALQTARLHAAVTATFTRRGTHALPVRLPQPPQEWRSPFAALAAECNLSVDIAGAYALADRYWQNILLQP